MTSASIAGQLPQSNNILRYLPLISAPACDAEKYEVDHLLALTRAISGTALSALAMVGISWICPPVGMLIAQHDIVVAFSPIVLPLIFGMIETSRANTKADALAVEIYKTNIAPSPYATRRLCQSSRAFQQVLGETLYTKCHSEGRSLAEEIFSSRFTTPKVAQMFIDSTHFDPMHPISSPWLGENITTTPLRLAVRYHNERDHQAPCNLNYMLEQRKVEINAIDSAEQFKIWKEIQRAETIKLLVQFNFDLHAKNSDGKVILESWLPEANSESFYPQNISLAITALNYGADIPQNKLEKLDSNLKLLYQQAKAFSNNNKTISLPKETGLLARLPWRPFVCENTYTIRPDHVTLLDRTTLVVLISLFGIEILGSAAAIGISISALLFSIEELWRGQKEAERLAVCEYLTLPIPSKQAAHTISTSAAATRLLIKHDAARRYLNKLDEKGQSLLSRSINHLKVFELLINNGATIFTEKHPTDVFMRAVEHKSPKPLACVLRARNGEVKNSISEDDQVKMWASIGSLETAQLLQKFSFDPNLCDSQGNTALMQVAQTHDYSCFGKPSSIDKIRWLLSIGADPSKQNSNGKTAHDLTRNPQVKTISEEASPRASTPL